MTEKFLHDSDRPDRGDGGDRRLNSKDLESILNLGAKLNDIEHIKEGMTRIERIVEQGFARGGERFGNIENKVNGLELTIAKHEEADKAVADNVKDLKDGRKWFITTIGATLIATVWGWIKH